VCGDIDQSVQRGWVYHSLDTVEKRYTVDVKIEKAVEEARSLTSAAPISETPFSREVEYCSGMGGKVASSSYLPGVSVVLRSGQFSRPLQEGVS
jgi:hypothetical protein